MWYLIKAGNSIAVVSIEGLSEKDWDSYGIIKDYDGNPISAEEENFVWMQYHRIIAECDYYYKIFKNYM